MYVIPIFLHTYRYSITLCVTEMNPISEDDILFLSEPDQYNSRKGVTVNSVDLGRGKEEVRIAIWQFVKLQHLNGYITPQRRGISLTPVELAKLKEHLPVIDEKVAVANLSAVENYLSTLTKTDIDSFRKRLDELEKKHNLGTDSPDVGKKHKKQKKDKDLGGSGSASSTN